MARDDITSIGSLRKREELLRPKAIIRLRLHMYSRQALVV